MPMANPVYSPNDQGMPHEASLVVFLEHLTRLIVVAQSLRNAEKVLV